MPNIYHVNRLKPGYIRFLKYSPVRQKKPDRVDKVSPEVLEPVKDNMECPVQDDYVYEIKKILSSFYDRKRGKRWYKIWWCGYKKSESSFEPEENLSPEFKQAYIISTTFPHLFTACI